jgi:hypothetical protein
MGVGRGRPEGRPDSPMLSSAPLAERSHSGLVRRFAKPLKGVSSSEGSNPSLSATAVAHVPVAQWIERQVADLKVGGSSPLGHATATHSPMASKAARSRPGIAWRLRWPRPDQAQEPGIPSVGCSASSSDFGNRCRRASGEQLANTACRDEVALPVVLCQRSLEGCLPPIRMPSASLHVRQGLKGATAKL